MPQHEQQLALDVEVRVVVVLVLGRCDAVTGEGQRALSLFRRAERHRDPILANVERAVDALDPQRGDLLIQLPPQRDLKGLEKRAVHPARLATGLLEPFDDVLGGAVNLLAAGVAPAHFVAGQKADVINVGRR